MSKAFKLNSISKQTYWIRKTNSIIQIITAEKNPVAAHLPRLPHTYTPTHILLTQSAYTYHSYHQPDIPTSLDPYTA